MKKRYQKAVATRIEIGTLSIIAASGAKSLSNPSNAREESIQKDGWGSLWSKL